VGEDMTQLLLFPDPRPLVERLGVDFFRQAPEGPGVYLMRDAADTVLYVGKAKNLRKRLASYRVANPDRMRRRQLRLLCAVARIELEHCLDEPDALSRESQLLRQLRPRFNRAGTWPGLPRFLAWRLANDGLHLAVTTAVEPGWGFHGPLGAAAISLRAAMVRLVWCAVHPERGLAGMPEGWFHGRQGAIVRLSTKDGSPDELEAAYANLALAEGRTEAFINWIRERTSSQTHPFEIAVREADLETVCEIGLDRPGLETGSIGN
jgi:predicted GIY-YIG superfamily endonuclease